MNEKSELQYIGESFVVLGNSAQAAADAISRLKKALDLLAEKIREYPNKRILHLALFSRKKRIRKKNLARILRDIQINEVWNDV